MVDERHSYGFGVTWVRVNDERIVIFGWTMSLIWNQAHGIDLKFDSWIRDCCSPVDENSALIYWWTWWNGICYSKTVQDWLYNSYDKLASVSSPITEINSVYSLPIFLPVQPMFATLSCRTGFYVCSPLCLTHRTQISAVSRSSPGGPEESRSSSWSESVHVW